MVLAGRFYLETAWCVTRLRGAPAWAVLSYSFVGCVVLFPCGCIALLLRGLRCIAPLWLYCTAPSWAALYCSLVGCVELLLRELCCVDSLQAVLYRYFVSSVEVLFDSPSDETCAHS